MLISVQIPKLPGHGCVLQRSSEDPLQSNPPCAGAGFVHDLFLVPEPQVLLHLVQELRGEVTTDFLDHPLSRAKPLLAMK